MRGRALEGSIARHRKHGKERDLKMGGGPMSGMGAHTGRTQNTALPDIFVLTTRYQTIMQLSAEKYKFDN